MIQSASALSRWHGATRAAAWHLGASVLVALLTTLLVFGLWYPHPFDKISGGKDLFLLVVAIDIVCGPLLTLVVFSPSKPAQELRRDLGIIVLIQIAALAYGLHNVALARPLFLVHEVDRFRVISEPDFLGADVRTALDTLQPDIRPRWFGSPRVVGVRPLRNVAEREAVLFESVNGGRDQAQRPDLYVPYDAAYANRAAQSAKPVARFVERFPQSMQEVNRQLQASRLQVADALFLPVVHRQDWVVLLSARGQIVGFVPGDGFIVP